MSPEAVTAERVYLALRAEIVRGRYLPGTEIVVSTIAREQNVSISPVRDGAQRLVGERLLEPLPAGGFRMPALTVRGLRDLYYWHGQLLRIGVDGAQRHDANDLEQLDSDLRAGSAVTLANAAREIFQTIAGWAGNGELCSAVASVANRLQTVRVKEYRHVPKLREELVAMRHLLVRQDRGALLRAIGAYDQRRLNRVDKLVEASGGTLDAETECPT